MLFSVQLKLSPTDVFDQRFSITGNLSQRSLKFFILLHERGVNILHKIDLFSACKHVH